MLYWQILIDGFAISALYALGATGFTLIFGVSGVLNLAHGAIMVGAAVAAFAATSELHLGPYPSALIGVVQNPGLYRCAISIDGVADWPAQLAYLARLDASGYARTKDYYGDPQADAAELADISPINHIGEIGSPLLLVYGNVEFSPRESARAFAKALAKANKPHEFVAKFDEIEGFNLPKPRAELLGRIERFLAQHMAPTATQK